MNYLCCPDVSLPNNYTMALKRYQSLERILRSNSELHKAYKGMIDGNLSADPPYARKMTSEEVRRHSNRTNYIPTHPVFIPKKPGKTRVVNDSAAVYKGISLNKNLATGPDQLNSLPEILLRLRIGKMVLAADIEAMFHQVRVCQKDADALRFLWKDDISKIGPPEVYQMLVHIFGATCSPTCCSHALKKSGRDAECSAMTYETIIKNFYMDDLFKSVELEEAAIQLAKELVSVLKSTGFRLCKFVSN